MIAIISPAKKLGSNIPENIKTSNIAFAEESMELIEELKKFNPEEISSLMKISPKLGELNYERYIKWHYPFTGKEAAPAVFMFNGDVYRGMNPKDFDEKDLIFAQNHLRILSGLYGLLKPADKILPYRLEAGTKIKIKGHKNLYEFWGNKITDKLNEHLSEQKNKIIVNLASDEYYKLIKPNKINGKILKIVFKEEKNGNYKVVAIHAKRARGLMCGFLIKNKITEKDEIKAFDSENYAFNNALSAENEFVFTR